MFRSFVRALYRLAIRHLPDRGAVALMYYRHLGKLPNLRSPATFSEKIAWRKIHSRDPRYPVFSDKLAAKSRIAELVGSQHVTPTLWSGTDPAAIPYERLTAPYVIKTNHGSGGNIFIRKPADIRRPAIAESMAQQLQHSHGREFREWGYLGIAPVILIEPMICVADGSIPDDYKFFVYDGKARFIQHDCGRFGDHRRNLYDIDWNLLPVTLHYPAREAPAPRPAALAEMIRIAERIGQQFDFVRVDLYSTTEGVRFGEAAFYPGSGHEAFTPPEWDLRFGQPWHLDTRARVALAPSPQAPT